MKETVLLGGYTRREGKGIYRATLDTEAATLSTPEAFITTLGSPTYLAVSKANALYAIDGVDKTGGLASFDLATTPATLLNTVLEPGSSPAHVSIDEARQFVFASNYHEGRINVYRINADKSLTAADSVTHDGKGPRPEQEASHVHFADLTPDGRLAVVDLGNDTVTVYDVSDAGKLTLVSTLVVPEGYGPRHLVFNHGHNIAYLLGELSSQVSVLTYDQATGAFTLGDTLPTIPADWTAHNGAAAIRLTQDNKFLYVSNRGHNSITVYAVSDDGMHLTQIQQISTEGDFPRDFNLDPTEAFVLAVNQNSDNGTLYHRDAQTGLLTMIQKDIITPESTDVTFL